MTATTPDRLVILASESPRRRQLLAKLNIPFEICPAAAEEISGGADPYSVPEYNAVLKARSAAVKYPHAAVIGADTVIVFDGRIIGKPHDTADAAATLTAFSGRSHEVITGVALICRELDIETVWHEISRVTFKTLSPETVKQYLSSVNVLDKAGSYALQENGSLLIRSFDGDPDNIVGLPLARLKSELFKLIGS